MTKTQSLAFIFLSKSNAPNHIYFQFVLWFIFLMTKSQYLAYIILTKSNAPNHIIHLFIYIIVQLTMLQILIN